MHFTILFIAGLFLLFCQPEKLYAADIPDPTPTVSLQMRQVPLLDVLMEIEKQTGMFFSYESSLLKDMPNVSFAAKDESLTYCLKRLFAPLSVIHRVTGSYIILKQKPRQYTISGFVRDSASYENLLGASVQELHSGQGAVSNNYGFYSFTLPSGAVRLRVSYVGYGMKEVSFLLMKDTLLDLSMKSIGNLSEVVVEALTPRAEVLNSLAGRVDLPVKSITSMPALLGEPDLIKTLQQLPGVAQGVEGMTGMYVRGGNADENLYLIDGNPLYHINHLGGLFSTFNADALKNVTFYKGAFPAQYGGRASSVVDVRMKDGDRQEYHGNVSIGLISAKANVEGPIVKGRSSFNVAARRSWADLVTGTALFFTGRGQKEKPIMGFHFYDINAKVNHSFSDRSRLYANFYMGRDSYKGGSKYKDAGLQNLFHWSWGNLIGSANWNYVFSEKLFANFTTGYSRYRSRIQQTENAYNYEKLQQSSHRESLYRSNMEDVSFRADFDYRPHEKHRVRFGTDYLFHMFRPEHSSLDYWIKDSLVSKESYTVYADEYLQGHEFSLYAEDEMSLTNRLNVTAGLRHTLFKVQGVTYHSFQPRLSTRYMLLPQLSAKASYSKMNQYVHQLSNSYVNLPTDLWVPVTKRIPPIASHQFTAGLYYTLHKEYDFSLEGYYKNWNNLIEYKDESSVISSFASWDERVAIGKGRSYGMEVMARKPHGKTTGWIAYTLSWSERRFPDGFISHGEWFPFKYDNRHKVNIVLSHRVSKRVELNAAWTFASGNHMTLLTDFYYNPNNQQNNGYPGHGGMWGTSASNSGARNNYQLPAYHRLDLGVNIYRPKKSGNLGIWSVSLYNSYMKMNPFIVEPSIYHDENGKPHVYLQKTTLFAFLPSISYTYKF